MPLRRRHAIAVLLGIAVWLMDPWTMRAAPLPGLVIDGIDVDRPWPGRVRIPSYLGAFIYGSTVSADFKGLLSTKPQDTSALNYGVSARLGNVSGELLILNTSITLVQPYFYDNLLLIPGDKVTQTQRTLRVWRELLRWDHPLGRFHFDVGGRVSQILRELGGAGGAKPIELTNYVPSLEAVFSGRKVVGNKFGIHTRYTYALGRGDWVHEEASEFKIEFNYPFLTLEVKIDRRATLRAFFGIDNV